MLLKKSDELNGELRDFFELLKRFLKSTITKENTHPTFFAKDIRKTYRLHPMQLTRHLIQLEKRGYIKQVSNNRKNGYEYEIIEWQEYQALQEGINILDTILEKLKEQEEAKQKQHSSKEKTVKVNEIHSSFTAHSQATL